MRNTSTFFTILAILSLLAAGTAAAKDDSVEFLHMMQREGYADVAIDYLDELKADPNNAPPEIMGVWDLEMSKSKSEAARQNLAYSDAQAKQWTEESKALLDKFIKANPNRPEALQEAARWSEERAAEAQYDIVRANFSTDPAEKSKLLAEARKIFGEIRPRFADAEKASRAMLGRIPANPPTAKREDAVVTLGEDRLTVAMIDFFLAQTQEDGDERTAALNRSLKEFDAIYQDFREGNDFRRAFVGCRAHFFNGRILQLLGRTNDARDIYEEVLALDDRSIEEPDDTKQPAPGTARPARAKTPAAKKAGSEVSFLDSFFADVEQYYLQVLYQISKKDYIEEFKSWRTSHKATSEKTFGYQALTMDYVKHLLDTGKDKPDIVKLAVKVLTEMSTIPSPYTENAIKLLAQLDPNNKAGKGFEAAVIEGGNAATQKKWAEAIEIYEKAIAAADPKADAKRLPDVKNALVICYYYQAAQLYHEKKTDQAIAIAQKALAIPDLRATDAAPKLAVFVMNLLEEQYRGAADGSDEEKKAKSELLAKLRRIAGAIINVWAAREEGDAARIVLMRLAQAEGNMAEADKYLNAINPSSKEYAAALTEVGYSHWSKYQDAKKLIKANAASNAETKPETVAKAEEDRKLAMQYVEKSVAALDYRHAADAPMPDALRIAKMLLAEIYSEAGDKDSFTKAAALYQPLVDDILNFHKAFDKTALRIFNGAGQAWLQTGDVPNIVKLGEKYIELAPDDGQVNPIIMNFAKQLDNERKKALVETQSAVAAAQDAAATKLTSLTDLLVKVMVNLSKRKNLSPLGMVWLANNLANLGTDESKAAAADLIENIFDLVTSKPEFAKDETVQKAAVRLHSVGATILAERGEYQKAKDQIDAVIQKYPRALDPRISEAKILMEWAAKDPARYGQAIMKWDGLREKLEAISLAASKNAATTQDAGTQKIDPKYEVILFEADCFYRMAQKEKNKGDANDEAKKGLELLRPYLDFDANIRAPSDEYKELSVRYYAVAGKLSTFLGIQPPTRPKIKKTPAKS